MENIREQTLEMAGGESAIKGIQGKELKKNLKQNWQLHLLLLLPVAFIFVFCYIPMGGILIAFEDYMGTKGIMGSPWIGWANFEFVFSMPGFWSALWNTFKIAGLKILIGFPIPILVALMLNEASNKHFKKTIQTLVYLPYFLSWAILGGLFLSIFSEHGAVNMLLNTLGVGSVPWLSSDGAFLTMLVMTDVWKSFGYNTIIYLAAIVGIDSSLYEAAMVDGAGKWKQTWHITLSGILPMVMLLGILNLGSVLNANFDQVFMLINPLVNDKAQIIDTLVYDMTFVQRNFGVSTAIGLFKSVISMVFIFSGWYLAYKFTDYRVL